jgi:hypothetical protein
MLHVTSSHRHISHVTRHTSHVTRHTSHVTRHKGTRRRSASSRGGRRYCSTQQLATPPLPSHASTGMGLSRSRSVRANLPLHNCVNLTFSQVFARAKSVLERVVRSSLHSMATCVHFVLLRMSHDSISTLLTCAVLLLACTRPRIDEVAAIAHCTSHISCNDSLFQTHAEWLTHTRFLLVDRVAAELPHMSRAEIEEHEDW